MFIGMIYENGKAVAPTVLGRVPSEQITWSVEHNATNSVLVTNLNVIVMQAYGNVEASVTKISMFREIDDLQPFVPIFDVSSLPRTRLEKGEVIAIGPRSLKLSLNFRDNRADIDTVWDEVDEVRGEAAKHLQFIHELAYGAQGDLRKLAKDYLKEVGAVEQL
jgi:hypothetical protein